MKKHFLSITDLKAKEMEQIFLTAKELKFEVNKRKKYRSDLSQKTLVMLFEKPSLRTRLSFETGMTQLGGHAVYLSPSDIGLGVRESVADVAKVASGMANLLMARVFSHATVCQLALDSSVPVINGLSDWEHPCQILSDLFTIWEIKRGLPGIKIAYVGDGENNICHSLCLGLAILGMKFTAATPDGFKMRQEIVDYARSIGRKTNATLTETNDPETAVKGADVVYTDTWVSMGDEAEKAKRLNIFKPFQVTLELMKLAKPDALFMHDLPAIRGNEVSADVIDGMQSVVFQQAENRLHVQKALMLHLLGIRV